MVLARFAISLARFANSPFVSVACNDSVIDPKAPRRRLGCCRARPDPTRPSRCGTRRALDVQTHDANRRLVMPWSPTPTAHHPGLRALTGASAVLLLLSTGAVVAGDLNPPSGGPGSEASALYTLEDLYKRLETGEEGAKRSGAFAEPSSGPTTGTMHDLNAIMDKMPKKDDTDGAKAEDVTKDKKNSGA